MDNNNIKTPEDLVNAMKAYLENPPELTDESEEGILGEVNQFSEKWANEFKALIKRWFFAQEKRTGSRSITASNVGKCVRRLAYDQLGVEGEPLSYDTKIKFAIGDMAELYLGMLADAVGSPLQNSQELVEVGGIRGRIDGEIDEYVVDVKSMSPASFAINKREGVGDGFGYHTQIELYKHGREKKGAFICLDKSSGEVEVMYSPSDPSKVTKAVIKKAEAMAATLDNLPPRPYTLEESKKNKGKMKLPMSCKFCHHKANCWNIIGEGEGYNRSIEIFSNGPKN